jgi:hypothetical protein
MNETKQYEKLDGLPPYGPMYISVTDNDEPYFSEGYVVRFFKSDGSNWVANFRPGWTNYYNIFDYPELKTVIVFAGGHGYIMSPDNEKPKYIFGLTITDVLQTSNGSLVCSDGIGIHFFDNSNGQIWRSERISWDGIIDLEIKDDILFGKAYDPTNSNQEWSDFSLNLLTKKVEGGTWREFINNNQNFLVDKKKEKTWWKIWRRKKE